MAFFAAATAPAFPRTRAVPMETGEVEGELVEKLVTMIKIVREVYLKDIDKLMLDDTVILQSV
jgi:hypothetical protein